MQEAAIEKFKRFISGEKGMRLLVFGGLAGLVFILLSSWIPDKEEGTEAGVSPVQSLPAVDEAEEYAAALEKRLENMLMEIDGVGRCSVMITVSGSVSYSYAQDAEQYINTDTEEIKRRHVILDEESGDSALVEYAKNPEVIGVIIACEGGEHSVVREQIIDAVGAVLDIPSNRICVTKRIIESGDKS